MITALVIFLITYLVSAFLSNLVSNVPAVILLKPFTESLGGDRIVWLALAMSSTPAGNFTLIGSVANLIVAQQARRTVEIGFMEYFRVGALITVITIAIGILVLIAEVKMVHGAEAATEAGTKPLTATVIPAGPRPTKRNFKVVLVCDTAESRSRGLQGFRPLQKDEAALFVFEKPEQVTFWMGSVVFPIDILFVAADGKVVRGDVNVTPGSRDVYPSEQPVKWVIETAAGSGVRVGDRVKIE